MDGYRVEVRHTVTSDFFASASCILDAQKLQRHTKVHSMGPVGHKDRSINWSEDVFVEYIVPVISVAVLVAVV